LQLISIISSMSWSVSSAATRLRPRPALLIHVSMRDYCCNAASASRFALAPRRQHQLVMLGQPREGRADSRRGSGDDDDLLHYCPRVLV
jgi:hypothetical protein